LINFGGGDRYGPDVALCFGADMPALPGRAPFLHRRQHFLHGRCNPLRVQKDAWRGAGLEGVADHGLDRIGSAERFGGLGVPGGPLLGQNAGFMLGVPGLQGGLLRQLQRLHRRRRPTMITLKPRRQLTLPVLDQHPPRRPALVQRGVNTDNLPHPPLIRVGDRPICEPHPQPVVEVVFQGGVVSFRGSHRGFEQHPSVDRQPPSVKSLHLVRDGDVSVQIRVTSSRVAVGERGRDQAGDVDLPNPVPALPGEQCVAFEEVQCILHGSLVRLLDLRGHLRGGDRPQARH
jgi:hypothetical protein